MADKKALLVIDMQNDYLWEARKAKFSYPTKELVDAVNETAAAYQSRGYDVIYLLQVFPDLITNRRPSTHPQRRTVTTDAPHQATQTGRPSHRSRAIFAIYIGGNANTEKISKNFHLILILLLTITFNHAIMYA